MNIEIFTFCWNEMNNIPWAVRYWKKYASHVTVFDNGSNDGSVDLLRSYDFIDVVPYDTGGATNNTILQYMKNEAWKEARGRADLVIVCDMDEMVCAPDITRSLATMRRVGGTICTPLWYDLVSDELPDSSCGLPLHRVRPLAVKTPGKAVLFDPNKITEINYDAGAHSCHPEGEVRWFEGDIYCLHTNHNYSFAYKLARYRMLDSRRSDMDREKGHGIHYAFPEQKLRYAWERDRDGAVNLGAILDG